MLVSTIKTRILVIAIGLVMGINHLYASGIYTRFTNLSVNNGLSHGWVNHIIQDKQGFMWFATDDGLNRYDGKTFNIYRGVIGDTNSLGSNSITRLLQDADDNIWIGTNIGLNILDAKTNLISRIDLNNTYYVTSIEEYNDSIIFVSTYTGLFVINRNNMSWKQYLINKSDPENGINRFRTMVIHNSKVLVFSEGGIFSLSLEKPEFDLLIPNNDSFRGRNARTAIIQNNILWVGMTADGLYYADLKSNKAIKKLASERFNELTIFAIYPNVNENELIIGTEDNGILHVNLCKELHQMDYTNQIVNLYGDSKGLINNSVHSIYLDQQSNLWFGTYNGISYLNHNGLSFGSLSVQVNDHNSLSNPIVNSIIPVNNEVWVGTEKGIDIYDTLFNRKNTILSGKGSNTLLASAVLCFEKADDGNVWVGTWNGGIDILNSKGTIIKQISKATNSLQRLENSTMAIEKDMNGYMWVGTMGGGVVVYSPNGKVHSRFVNEVKNPKSLDNDWIRDIFISTKNEVWVSTHGGLCLLNKQTNDFTRFNHIETDSTSIASNGIVHMIEDVDGNIWFGTMGGLSCFNITDSTFQNFYTTHGLPANYIQSLACDANNVLWIASNSGLSKLDLFKWTEGKVEFENFDIYDGLLSNNFVRRSVTKANNGELYFGTRDGLIALNPSHILSNSFIPPVYITRLFINNKPVEPLGENTILSENITITSSIELSHNQSNISFEFSALNYVASRKNQYSYKLNGFDKEWSEVSNESKANYTNLPAGDYTFQVLASNNRGVWNNDGASIKIHINPPWYRTKMAYIIYLFIIAMLIYSYRYFIVVQINLESKLELEQIEKENLSKINKMKTRFFTNISHEFLTPLSLIISPLDTLINNGDTLNNQIKPIHRNAKLLQKLISQMLDISKIEANHLELRVTKANIKDFTYDIFVAFKSLADKKNICFYYKSNLGNNAETIYFDSDKVEKIIYNLLSNAIKFTPNSGSVTLTINLTREFLNIIISDNGEGISKDEHDRVFESFYRSKKHLGSTIGTGIGLSLVKGLVNVYGGSLQLESEPGKGTIISVALPYHKNQFDSMYIDETAKPFATTIDILEDYSENPFPKAKPNKLDDNLPHVLIVEDNVELNHHMSEVLSKQYRVSSAFNGIQAFELSKQTIPDLIVSDVVMPEGNGIDFLMNIRRHESTSHIPFILLSARVDVEDKIKGLETGADAYMTKPFDQKHLETNIINLINIRENLKKKYKQNIVSESFDNSVKSVDQIFIKKAVKLVEDNINNPEFTVEFFAKELGLSRVQLHRKLKGVFGITASNFIRDIKIKRAAQLLSKGKYTVSEVMYEVNINSRAYFNKCFKEVFGVSPSDYNG